MDFQNAQQIAWERFLGCADTIEQSRNFPEDDAKADQMYGKARELACQLWCEFNLGERTEKSLSYYL